MKKTIIFSVIMCFIIGAFGFAEGQQEQTGEGAAEVAEIDYWTNQTQEQRMARYKQLAKEFGAETGHKVNIIPYGEQQGFATKYQAAKMAGNLPHVVETDGPFTTLKLISDEVLLSEPAEQVISDLGEDDFYDFFLNLVSFDGKYWGVPYLCFLNGIYYRTDWFQDAGIEPFTEPVTFDEMLNAAEKLHRPDERIYGVALGTAKVWYTFQVFNHFARAADARIFDKQGNVVADSDEMVRALRFYKDITQYNMPGAVASGDAFKGFPDGRAAMVDIASYLINYIETSRPEVREKTGYVYKVKDSNVSSYASLGALVAIKGMSDLEQQVSQEWMKWLMTGNRRTDFLHIVPGGFNPVRKSVLTSDAYLAPEIYQKWGPETFTQIVNGAPDATLLGWFDDGTVIPEIGDVAKAQVIQQAVYDLTQKDKTPEEIAKQIKAQSEEVLGF